MFSKLSVSQKGFQSVNSKLRVSRSRFQSWVLLQKDLENKVISRESYFFCDFKVTLYTNETSNHGFKIHLSSLCFSNRTSFLIKKNFKKIKTIKKYVINIKFEEIK